MSQKVSFYLFNEVKKGGTLAWPHGTYIFANLLQLLNCRPLLIARSVLKIINIIGSKDPPKID